MTKVCIRQHKYFLKLMEKAAYAGKSSPGVNFNIFRAAGNVNWENGSAAGARWISESVRYNTRYVIASSKKR